jgi:hypothetical protein
VTFDRQSVGSVLLTSVIWRCVRVLGVNALVANEVAYVRLGASDGVVPADATVTLKLRPANGSDERDIVVHEWRKAAVGGDTSR